MNIAIEARSLSATSGGVKTYTRELIASLLALHPDADIELLYGSNKPVGTFPKAKETVIPLSSELLLSYWLSLQVGRHVNKTKPSVVHYTKAAVPNRIKVPTVVTLYDIIPVLLPGTQSPLRRIYWPYVLEHAAKNANHIMTISEQSKKDIMEHYGTPEDKITVTPLAIDTKHFYPRPAAKNDGTPYLLFIGTRDARKNVSTLIRAFAKIADQIPHRLIVGGRIADKKDDSKETVAELRLEDRVEFRDYVPYEELPALYSGASLFVWPSVYEGWGFPPQEAMACGTPVIVSNGGPLPEVVGDAGIIVPFTKRHIHERMNDEPFIEALSEKMLEVLQDPTLQAALREKGLLRTTLFSWKNVAEKTWEVYERLAS